MRNSGLGSLIVLYSDFAVVRIDVEQSIYEVTEDAGSVEICANLSGPNIERSLAVFLVTSEDTAQGIKYCTMIYLHDISIS